jgi:hypothetical protein
MASKMKKPDQQVSESIAKAMIKAGFLAAESEKDMANKIALGALTSTSWTILFKEQIQEEANKTEQKP